MKPGGGCLDSKEAHSCSMVDRGTYGASGGMCDLMGRSCVCVCVRACMSVRVCVCVCQEEQ